MPPGIAPFRAGPADLDAFVAANLGCVLDADAGPWVGVAAMLADTHEPVEPRPPGWDDAVSAALDPH
jgi:hypothetical protein